MRFKPWLLGNLSLRLRSFAAAVLALVIFIPLTVVTLQQAFSNSLAQAMLEQLQVHSLTLISEFEMDEGVPSMPEQLFNDRLNIPGSGLYAFIEKDGEILWRSLSSLNWQDTPQFIAPPVGGENFMDDFTFSDEYFLFAYTAEFESEQEFVPISFYLLQDKNTFISEQRSFSKTLWKWLGLVAVLLLILLIASLRAALSPIDQLIQQIKLAEAGEIQHIKAHYPLELEKLKNSLNHLLATEQQQRSRYKNSLSDLAHSLKTPLAVLAGNKQLPEDAQEPIKQIDSQIQRQLKRAVAGSLGAFEQATDVEPVLKRLVNAMHKVYADKTLSITLNVSKKPLKFRGDKTDLMEILGNVLDNACKAACAHVQITALSTKNDLLVCIDDDGAGIAEDKRSLLLNRGIRLDSYTEGQGIGMAVVADLVSAYEGQLEINDSEIGGASITLRFPIS